MTPERWRRVREVYEEAVALPRGERPSFLDGSCDADCSLREAVVAANALDGIQDVQLSAGIYELTLAGAGEDAAASGDLDATESIVISGAGANLSEIDANGLDRVLDLHGTGSAELRGHGLEVVMTRDEDAFVSLEKRTHIANDARGDLFVSIHANAAGDVRIRGTETFFLSLDATDDDARSVAERENLALGTSAASLGDASDPVLAILSSMSSQEHLVESQEFARMAQERLRRIDPRGSRGVKQAPFVVLSGVLMPAALVEVGFITHPAEERVLRSRSGRKAVVASLTDAVLAFGRRHAAQHRAGVAPAGAGR